MDEQHVKSMEAEHVQPAEAKSCSENGESSDKTKELSTLRSIAQMNINSVPDRTAADVEQLVLNQMQKIADPIFLKGSEDSWSHRAWRRVHGSGKSHSEIIPYGWSLRSKGYDYGIAFSDYGFAPENPWGLVFLPHTGFDAEYCWYPTPESAY